MQLPFRFSRKKDCTRDLTNMTAASRALYYQFEGRESRYDHFDRLTNLTVDRRAMTNIAAEVALWPI